MGRIQQRIGRVMRRAENKKQPVVIDLVDTSEKLFRQHEKREQFYKKLGCKVQEVSRVLNDEL